MLNLRLNLRIDPKTKNFARSLRVIGQSLAALFPEYLEIELNGADYFARGNGRAEAIRAVTPCQTGVLGTIWNKLARQKSESEPVQPPSSIVAFEHAYTVADIDRLDQTGTANRRSTGCLPDIYSLAERLRTVGRIIDSRGGQLIKLIMDMDAVKFQYRDRENKVCLAEYSNFALYKLQQEYYAQRSGPESTDPWNGIAR
jgi:hypothetical protein